MWADRCTQRPHCALCALNTNVIWISSTTGLSSGYGIKPSPLSSFSPHTLQSYKSNANQDPCVRCHRIEFYWNQKCFKVYVYRCQTGSSAVLRHADRQTDRHCALNWRKPQLHRLILLQSQNVMFVDPCIIVQFLQKIPTRCNSVSKFIIPYLYEAQHVSGDTPPIIRSLNLH